MRDVERGRIAPSITGTHLNSGPSSERRRPWSRKQNDATPRINRSLPTGARDQEHHVLHWIVLLSETPLSYIGRRRDAPLPERPARL
jgi:hypothetical protein